MNKKKRTRFRRLMNTKEFKLIGIDDVALVFGISVPTARNYKMIGVIEPRVIKGRTDLFDLLEVRWGKSRLGELRSTDHSLKQAGKILERERVQYRKNNARAFDPPDDYLL